MKFIEKRLLAIVSALILAAMSQVALADSYGYSRLTIDQLIVWKGNTVAPADKTNPAVVGVQWDVSDFAALAISNGGSTSADLGSDPGFEADNPGASAGAVDPVMACEGVCVGKGQNDFDPFFGSGDFNRGDAELTGAVITFGIEPNYANANMVAEFEHSATDCSVSEGNLGTATGFVISPENDGETIVVDLEGIAINEHVLDSDVQTEIGQLSTTFRIRILGPGDNGADSSPAIFLDWVPGVGTPAGTQHISGGQSLNLLNGLPFSGPHSGTEGDDIADFWRAESLPLTAGVQYQFIITSSARVSDCATIVEPIPVPGIEIKKYVSVTGPAGVFDDAQTPTGPEAADASNQIYFRLVINNTGDEDLVLDTLTDTILEGPNAPIPAADLNACLAAAPTPLPVGGSFTCPGDFGPYATVPAGSQHGDSAVITAYGLGSGITVTDSDPAYYFVRSGGGQGCTPGYWKQPQHEFAWTGYSTSDDYEDIFGIDASFGAETLLEVLKQGGGGEIALGRHAVAALLNAANPDVSYAFTQAEVIAKVQQAYATGEFEGLKDLYDEENNSGCPLGNGK